MNKDWHIMQTMGLNKGLILGIVATLIIIVGGIFLFTRGSTSETGRISDSILISSDSQKTSGVVNGVYQPASSSAKVTLVEFADYQCPACATYSPLIQKLLTELPGKLNLVYRNYPLPQHKNANVAAYAAEAAGLQGKFWEMNAKLYQTQTEWAVSDDAQSLMLKYAGELKLNLSKFKTDVDSDKIKEKVAKDLADGNLAGVDSTPTLFLNGIKLLNPRSYEAFKKSIEDAIDKVKVDKNSDEEVYHAHFDLKVYLSGKAIDFTQTKYQSTHENELNPDIHFHDGNGAVVHLHKEGMRVRDLFDSFGLTLQEGTPGYVNGAMVENILDYSPLDLDRILIGSTQTSAVTNDACIYSEKCPERGTPPEEECVGGLGTGCEK